MIVLVFYQGQSYGAEDYTKTPVFFVHGHGMGPNCWDRIIQYLKQSGYPSLYLRAIQLRPNNGPNIPAAEKQIAPAVDDFLKEVNSFLKKEFPQIAPKSKIDSISHSMGALSARWYTAKINPGRVRVWLSLAGANHGSNVACAFSDPGSADACPAFAESKEKSLIQYELNRTPHKADVDETPYGIGQDAPGVHTIAPDKISRMLYVTLWTSPDPFIKPEESATLDGAGGVKILIPANIHARETTPGNILMTNGVGHDEMLQDGDVFRLVKIILDQSVSVNSRDNGTR